MKKLLILGLVTVVLLTGCTVDFFNNINLGSLDEKYRFKTYDEFQDLKSEIEKENDLFYIERHEEMDIEDLKSMDLSTIFEDIIIEKTTGEVVEVDYFGVFSESSISKEPTFDVDLDDHFTFHVEWKNLNGPSHALMVVRLPEKYDGELELYSVSGDVEVAETASEIIKVGTTSGDIEIEKATGERIKLNSVSGDIDLLSLMFNELNANSTSGDVRVKGEVDQVRISTVSGEVKLELMKLNGDIEIDSTSGDVQLEFDKSINATLDLATVSGDVDCYQKLDQVKVQKDNKLEAELGSGKYSIEIDTVSGDIKIF